MNRKFRKLILNACRAGRHYQREDELARRQSFANRVYFKQEDGWVYLVISGMDCDGVQYSGLKTLVRAIPTVINKRIEENLKWADGPMYFDIMSPHDGDKVQYSSRDLGMEAFENGHPHVLYS